MHAPTSPMSPLTRWPCPALFCCHAPVVGPARFSVCVAWNGSSTCTGISALLLSNLSAPRYPQGRLPRYQWDFATCGRHVRPRPRPQCRPRHVFTACMHRCDALFTVNAAADQHAMLSPLDAWRTCMPSIHCLPLGGTRTAARLLPRNVEHGRNA